MKRCIEAAQRARQELGASCFPFNCGADECKQCTETFGKFVDRALSSEPSRGRRRRRTSDSADGSDAAAESKRGSRSSSPMQEEEEEEEEEEALQQLARSLAAAFSDAATNAGTDTEAADLAARAARSATHARHAAAFAAKAVERIRPLLGEFDYSRGEVERILGARLANDMVRWGATAETSLLSMCTTSGSSTYAINYAIRAFLHRPTLRILYDTTDERSAKLVAGGVGEFIGHPLFRLPEGGTRPREIQQMYDTALMMAAPSNVAELRAARAISRLLRVRPHTLLAMAARREGVLAGTVSLYRSRKVRKDKYDLTLVAEFSHTDAISRVDTNSRRRFKVDGSTVKERRVPPRRIKSETNVGSLDVGDGVMVRLHDKQQTKAAEISAVNVDGTFDVRYEGRPPCPLRRWNVTVAKAFELWLESEHYSKWQEAHPGKSLSETYFRKGI